MHGQASLHHLWVRGAQCLDSGGQDTMRASENDLSVKAWDLEEPRQPLVWELMLGRVTPMFRAGRRGLMVMEHGQTRVSCSRLLMRRLWLGGGWYDWQREGASEAVLVQVQVRWWRCEAGGARAQLFCVQSCRCYLLSWSHASCICPQ